MGLRKIIPLCVDLAEEIGASGWRQNKHWLRRIKQHIRTIAQISASKSPKVKAGLPSAYQNLLDRAATIMECAQALKNEVETAAYSVETVLLSGELAQLDQADEQVCDTAYRRVILGESVPNSEKLFSLFEPHTQLYRRGKAGEPNQFGRLVLVYEDGAGFLSHYHLMDRDARDADVVVEQTRNAKRNIKAESRRHLLTAAFIPPRTKHNFLRW